MDWDAINAPEVMAAVELAAARVAREWAPSFEYDDLYQEALIVVAQAGYVEAALEAGGRGALYHRLWSDLTNIAAKQNRRLHLNTSLEAIMEDDDE